jgi:hypothetical protein
VREREILCASAEGGIGERRVDATCTAWICFCFWLRACEKDFARDNIVFWLVQALLEKKIRREKDAAGKSETRWQMPSALL